MTPHSWSSQPHFRLTVGGTNIDDDQAVSIRVVRPENNISHAELVVNDYKSKNYVDVFDAFTSLDVSFKYGSAAWATSHKVFSGMINSVNPQINENAELLEVTAWGWEWGLVKTGCNTSFGTESINPSWDTPQDIFNAIIDNYVNDTFGSAPLSTEWELGVTKVEDVHSDFSVTHLSGVHLDNFTLFGKLCDLVSAHAQDLNIHNPVHKGIHWFVDPSKNVYVKKIDTDSADGTWDRYWGGTAGTDPGTQASSTIAVKEDMIRYDFRKNIDEYANFIVLATDFRKPAYDIWSEDGGPAWGVLDSAYSFNATHIVGSHSVLFEPTGAGGAWAYAYYPSTYNAGWDFTSCGSQNSVPHFSFYWRANLLAAFQSSLLLFTDLAIFGGGHADAYFSCAKSSIMAPVMDKWIHFNLPIGDYWSLDPSLQKGDETSNFEWTTTGAASWGNINGICIAMGNDATYDVYMDDVHFAGKLIRRAYDSSEITATKKEHQKFVLSPNALDDSLKASVDTGTAARLAYAELLRRSRTGLVGVIQIPGAPTLLPGQTVHIHSAQKSDNTYRIDSDMRVKELRHVYDIKGFRTQLNLTDDVFNSNVFGVPSIYGLLLEQAYGLTHGEARDLKSSNVDPLITALSKSY